MQKLSAVPILTYHSLDRSGSVISVTPRTFERHMAVLSERGFSSLRLIDLFEVWDGKAPLPALPIVLTFDDGFANFLERAVPVLKDFSFTATIFPVAGFVGKFNDWNSQPAGIPKMPLLSWADLREVARQGFEIGGHSMTHPQLHRLSSDDLHSEVVQSKMVLEDRLGQEVKTFAYPYGVWSDTSRCLVAQQYSGACSGKLGVARSHDDRYLLKRVDVYYFRALPLFETLGTPLGWTYLSVRALGRRLLRNG